MKRILLDEGVPIGLVKLLREQEVHHVRDVGWTGISDTEMIARAVENHFEVLVTTDQSMPFQQNLRERSIGLVVIRTTNWRVIRERLVEVQAAIESIEAGRWNDCIATT